MQVHMAQQIERGPAAGRWIYAGGSETGGRYAECCSEAWREMLQTPGEQRDASPAWDRIGHATREEATAHMRQRLLDERLRLDGTLGNWSGCRAPVGEGVCDAPTKGFAEITPMWFGAALCDEHRTREVVEAMWDGPGEQYGSV